MRTLSRLLVPFARFLSPLAAAGLIVTGVAGGERTASAQVARPDPAAQLARVVPSVPVARVVPAAPAVKVGPVVAPAHAARPAPAVQVAPVARAVSPAPSVTLASVMQSAPVTQVTTAVPKEYRVWSPGYWGVCPCEYRKAHPEMGGIYVPEWLPGRSP
jgi:hypothetical protein